MDSGQLAGTLEVPQNSCGGACLDSAFLYFEHVPRGAHFEKKNL